METRKTRWRLYLVCIIVLVIWGSAQSLCWAQNLLVNPDFDTGVSGWDPQGDYVSIVWNALDASGSLFSGSGEVRTCPVSVDTKNNPSSSWLW
jgi:hypothetical protein